MIVTLVQTLSALGHGEIQACDLVDWDSAKPSLKLRKSWPLPSASRHDLAFPDDRLYKARWAPD